MAVRVFEGCQLNARFLVARPVRTMQLHERAFQDWLSARGTKPGLHPDFPGLDHAPPLDAGRLSVYNAMS
jgi:hypothetical protein